MPNCFQLTPKGASEAESLNSIDEKICAFMGVSVHPTKYAFAWYDNIGFFLAMGKSINEIKKLYYNDADIVKICDWLNEHYSADCWVEVGRR